MPASLHMTVWRKILLPSALVLIANSVFTATSWNLLDRISLLSWIFGFASTPLVALINLTFLEGTVAVVVGGVIGIGVGEQRYIAQTAYATRWRELDKQLLAKNRREKVIAGYRLAFVGLILLGVAGLLTIVIL